MCALTFKLLNKKLSCCCDGRSYCVRCVYGMATDLVSRSICDLMHSGSFQPTSIPPTGGKITTECTVMV